MNLLSSLLKVHFIRSTGNFHDTLNDVKAANELQPSYIKPIERGEVCWEVKRCLIAPNQIFLKNILQIPGSFRKISSPGKFCFNFVAQHFLILKFTLEVFKRSGPFIN